MKLSQIITTFFLSLTCLTTYAQKGTWSGKIIIQGMELPLVFNFNDNNCTLDSPSQGINNIPAEKSVDEDGTIKVFIKMIGATFEGKNVGECIEGTFTQNGFHLPLTLHAGKPTINRPQTPTPPFPYSEEEVSFTNSEYTFHGTLSLPKEYNQNTPIVLMITGSRQQNRDEEMLSHKPFAVIADALARNGIASLRYDDRGWNDKSINFANFTTNDFKQDAEAGLEFLRKRFSNVGILGHSEGGSIALLLAEEGKADFIVSLAGMVVSGKSTLIEQNKEALAAIGLPNDVISSYLKTLDTVLDDLASGKKISEIKRDNIPAILRPMFEKSLQQGDSKYIREFININPSRTLSQIKCPVLALNGTKDKQVNYATNLSALEKGLTNCPHTIKTMEGLNHLFQHCQTGNTIEYQQIEETISPEVLTLITEWINELKL